METMRNSFEEWALEEFRIGFADEDSHILARNGDEYDHLMVNPAWSAWKRCAAKKPAPTLLVPSTEAGIWVDEQGNRYRPQDCKAITALWAGAIDAARSCACAADAEGAKCSKCFSAESTSGLEGKDAEWERVSSVIRARVASSESSKKAQT